jgi:hypothetical protein
MHYQSTLSWHGAFRDVVVAVMVGGIAGEEEFFG